MTLRKTFSIGLISAFSAIGSLSPAIAGTYGVASLSGPYVWTSTRQVSQPDGTKFEESGVGRIVLDGHGNFAGNRTVLVEQKVGKVLETSFCVYNMEGIYSVDPDGNGALAWQATAVNPTAICHNAPSGNDVMTLRSCHHVDGLTQSGHDGGTFALDSQN